MRQLNLMRAETTEIKVGSINEKVQRVLDKVLSKLKELTKSYKRYRWSHHKV